jgi:hypothetical protein
MRIVAAADFRQVVLSAGPIGQSVRRGASPSHDSRIFVLEMSGFTEPGERHDTSEDPKGRFRSATSSSLGS